MDSFTEEELAIAKRVDLTAVAESLGYTVKRVGNYYTLKEMDSIRIYNNRNWFRWSRQYEKGENGGSQVDFLRVFAGLDIKEAVSWLLDFSSYRRTADIGVVKPLKHQVEVKPFEQKPFILPEPAKNNANIYLYLNQERAISTEILDYFIRQGLIYESKNYHNIVFKGNDKEGTTKFASMRGVFDKNGKSFKCDVAGNDKHYGFNDVHEDSSELIVFEAAIDLMSYMNIHMDFETNKVALGMLSDAPLKTFLEEHDQITTIRFCLDNDEPGRKATEQLKDRYYSLGYEVEDSPLPESYKDYNEWLVSLKRQAVRTERSMIR